ncbi:MAG: hypothetical protein K9G46_14630 [Flavobacteriales bacterium]|nr:hypothetical protein [Flavobacteriales bacterium]
MKNLKTTLLAFALLFSVNALMAQEKYDYVVITFSPITGILAISTNGTDFVQSRANKGEIQHAYDVSNALNQVNKLEHEGWELFNTGTTGGSFTYVFFMRRKEQ